MTMALSLLRCRLLPSCCNSCVISIQWQLYHEWQQKKARKKKKKQKAACPIHCMVIFSMKLSAVICEALLVYLLGLLAMIKCSICSYQCDNWYVSNWRLDCHIYFCWGNAVLSLLRSFHVLHQNCTLSGRSPPFGVTVSPDPKSMMECMCQTFWLSICNLAMRTTIAEMCSAHVLV